MAVTAQIPRMQPHQNPYNQHERERERERDRDRDRDRDRERDRERDRDRDSRMHSPPSSGRSPSSYSSSYRAHPYPRRSSSNSQPEQLPRLHLPPLGSGGSLPFSNSADSKPISPGEREFPPISTIQHESSWRSSVDRPQIHRMPSGGGTGGRSGISLPPLNSISGRQSPSMPPPMTQNSGVPPSSLNSSAGPSGRASPRVYPPATATMSHDSNGSSRFNHSTYDPYPHQNSGRSPAAGPSTLREREPRPEHNHVQGQVPALQHGHGHSHGHIYGHPHAHESYRLRNEHERARDGTYDHSQRHSRDPGAHSTVPMPNQAQQSPMHHPYEMSSPPLRALPPSSMPPAMLHGAVYHRGGTLVRSRSQSSASGLSRMPGDMSDEMAQREVAPTPGQSRRLAHLMSEQKRRESINSGFQALRASLPSSLPTDSKAIVLRKAVAHIAHLESVLRRSGVNYSQSPPGQVAEPWEVDRDEDEDREVKWEEDR
ncbi:hypothetical protein I316_06550 [Kwoniella heveanensis BCC8398]|uniref:BHLH domain-containing protein n=1 Tax=Kwoniella heveanensis BCC8398 TaxID=1296120 RepID=A0A1B9GL91_9TREE|nr:hypothetical protein I316_06550 [Kwoniella heveanensis BCC8398]